MEAMAERIGTFLDTPSMIFSEGFQICKSQLSIWKDGQNPVAVHVQRVADDTQYQHEMDHTKGIII